MKFKLLDNTNSMGEVRVRTNVNTVLAIMAIVLAVIAIVL